MRRSRRKNALTLVEVILAMMILSIIVIYSLNSLTGGFINIIDMGNKTRAVTEAQSLIDYIETSGFVDLGTKFPRLKEDAIPIADLETTPYVVSTPLFYSVEDIVIDSIAMKKITVLAYYQNGDKHIKISSMIKP